MPYPTARAAKVVRSPPAKPVSAHTRLENHFRPLPRLWKTPCQAPVSEIICNSFVINKIFPAKLANIIQVFATLISVNKKRPESTGLGPSCFSLRLRCHPDTERREGKGSAIAFRLYSHKIRAPHCLELPRDDLYRVGRTSLVVRARNTTKTRPCLLLSFPCSLFFRLNQQLINKISPKMTALYSHRSHQT